MLKIERNPETKEIEKISVDDTDLRRFEDTTDFELTRAAAAKIKLQELDEDCVLYVMDKLEEGNDDWMEHRYFIRRKENDAVVTFWSRSYDIAEDYANNPTWGIDEVEAECALVRYCLPDVECVELTYKVDPFSHTLRYTLRMECTKLDEVTTKADMIYAELQSRLERIKI